MKAQIDQRLLPDAHVLADKRLSISVYGGSGYNYPNDHFSAKLVFADEGATHEFLGRGATIADATFDAYEKFRKVALEGIGKHALQPALEAPRVDA